MYANGRAMEARVVQPGFVMTGDDGSLLTVAGVKSGTGRGLYNPQTLHGDIVVDGVVVSTYTESVEMGMAHALLAPIRAGFSTAKVVSQLFHVRS